MKYIECETYAEMSKKAAEIFLEGLKEKKDLIIGLATGSTPLGLYDCLAKSGEDFSAVRSFNLDEYVGLDENDEQSYRTFMNNNLFSKINIKPENTHVPNGKAEDVNKFGKQYDKMIEELGGIDIQLLGIGFDGHIGFNEPDENFVSATHKVKLTDSTIKANARFFKCEEDVCKSAVTMGMYTIMNAKKIVMVVNGKGKKEILDKAINGPITPEVPASIIQLHKDVTVFYTPEEFQ